MKPLESAEINRRNGLADECREMKLRRYINSLRPEQTYRFDDVWSLASPYWYSNEKYFSPIKRIYAHALGYFFDYLVSWLRDSYAKNTSIWNEVTFFFTIVATKFKEAFKGFGKKNEKKKKREMTIDGNLPGDWGSVSRDRFVPLLEFTLMQIGTFREPAETFVDRKSRVNRAR